MFRSRVDDDALALRLGAALHRFGPNCLLWVAPTSDKNAVGLVAPLADGVLKGLIDADSDWDNPVLDTWLELSERAYGHWRAVTPVWAGARGAR